MPKDTFFNLPEDKRALICKVAVAEFAKHRFDKASINRIVAQSGIAKGSFYQYFEDKRIYFSTSYSWSAKKNSTTCPPSCKIPTTKTFSPSSGQCISPAFNL
ncbi:MAG: TetR/AcrR family transcriptional regulator [Chloroflexi bacterium]|nr:TetR/AcrR family transcriptional regulator [Chloroflexota bacterium]